MTRLIPLILAAAFAWQPARADLVADLLAGKADGRAIQPHVDAALSPKPLAIYDAGELAIMRRSPDAARLIAAKTAVLDRPADMLTATPEAMIGAIHAYAVRHALTGEDYQGAKIRPILRMVRDRWPLPFANDYHTITLEHIPAMYEAAKLSPMARAELDWPLRWCEWRMIAPQAPRQQATSMNATNEIVGLRAMVQIRDVLYGRESGVGTALNGFGPYSVQWGLRRIIDEGIDAEGNPLWDVGREGHQANTSRAAMAWLLFRYDCWNLLNAEQRKKAWRYYQRPVKLLCVGGRSFNNALTLAVPSLKDEYAANPMLGPPTAWTEENATDRYVRYVTRRQGWSLSIDDLLLPRDEGYEPPERPRGCSGNRKIGPYTIMETATETTVTYTPRGLAEISGKAERMTQSVTVKVTR